MKAPPALVLALALVAPSAATAHGEPRPETGQGPFGYTVPSERACSTNVCVHWVEQGPDAVAGTDEDGDGIPDYVETVRRTMQRVWEIQVGRDGFRAPPGDGERGGDARPDVYLMARDADTVIMDEPGNPRSSRWTLLDVGPDPALLDVAAHEFFHVVQCAYDCLEDSMLAEGTAVWMADRAWRGRRDQQPTISITALAEPERPLDAGLIEAGPNPETAYASGSWLFWRFASEYLTGDGADPAIVRQIYEAAGAGEDGDRTSLEAAEEVFGRYGTTFREVFARFGARNVRPDLYEDGARYIDEAERTGLRLHPPVASFALGGSRRSTGVREVGIDHLATRYVRVRPARAASVDTTLRVEVDGPPLSEGTEASLVVDRRDGRVSILRMRVGEDGSGARSVRRFHRRAVRSVWLVLTNASTAYLCDQGTAMPCGGTPLHDDRSFSYRVRTTG